MDQEHGGPGMMGGTSVLESDVDTYKGLRAVWDIVDVDLKGV